MNLKDGLNIALADRLGIRGEVNVIQPVSGGSINNCYLVNYCSNRFFLKVNNATEYQGMFIAEAAGLRAIAETCKIASPEVIAFGEVANEQYLILQFIERGVNSPKAQSTLGTQLAEVHKCSNSYYGLDHNNYMGSISQQNGKFDSIAEFFTEQRLKVQVELASAQRLIDKELKGKFEILFNKTQEIIPDQPPALVHGDLWSGNYLIDSANSPYLIDPAVAFSHREVDIAMTQLFGGFGPDFYASYQESFPLESGWERRVSFWNLYPLLIHLNIFGRGYLNDIQRCLKQWI
ncbi:fructosamine kinase family protein [Desertivirga brevis]|uniref:fructosamine kinase family protein n=1 Tax=Desertivirga brevis TaxID=2810310 RepID=UPI001A970DE4|nr:fructosamine kinase family protein [Pedobacter sp. SYSU D00873]